MYQDTTELDFNGQEADGLGPLNYEARCGMYLHPTYAVTPGREPLGVLDAWMWAHEKRGKDGVRPGQKESARWIEGYGRVAEIAASLPATRLVYVPEHEADVMALMRRARVGHPGRLAGAGHAQSRRGRRREAVGAHLYRHGAGGNRLTMPAREDQKARPVRQQLWARQVEITDGKGGRLSVTCVVAREVGAPAGIEPTEWRLLSNRLIATVEQAVKLIEWYRARWEIEIYSM